MNPQYGLEKRLGYRFSILSTLNIRRIARVYTKKFGLSAAGWRILSIIGRYEPIFPGVAAQLSTMDADKVTRAVDRLVEMDYVIRNNDAADRRRVILCLSSRGRVVYDEIEELSQQMDAAWREVLTEEENKALDAIMEKLDQRARELFMDDPTNKRSSTPRAAAKRGQSKAQTTRRKAVET